MQKDGHVKFANKETMNGSRDDKTRDKDSNLSTRVGGFGGAKYTVDNYESEGELVATMHE